MKNKSNDIEADFEVSGLYSPAFMAFISTCLSDKNIQCILFNWVDSNIEGKVDYFDFNKDDITFELMDEEADRQLNETVESNFERMIIRVRISKHKYPSLAELFDRSDVTMRSFYVLNVIAYLFNRLASQE